MTIYDEIGEHYPYPEKRNILNSDCQTLVNPVNTVGVMGKGLAKAFADASPSMLYRYRKACLSGELHIKTYWVYKTKSGKQILCFPTKEHWRDPSRLEWIDHNLELLSRTYLENNIKSLAIPKIGCGLGGLNWGDVVGLIYKHLDPIRIPVYIYLNE